MDSCQSHCSKRVNVWDKECLNLIVKFMCEQFSAKVNFLAHNSFLSVQVCLCSSNLFKVGRSQLVTLCTSCTQIRI